MPCLPNKPYPFLHRSHTPTPQSRPFSAPHQSSPTPQLEHPSWGNSPNPVQTPPPASHSSDPPHQLSTEPTSPPPTNSSVHLQIPSGAGTPASPPSDREPYTAARTSTVEFFRGRSYSSNLRPLSLTHDNMVSPSKRMNLGKKVAPTGSHRLGVVPPGAYRLGRVNWDSQMTRLFLLLAIKEIEAEGRGTTQLSNNSLRNIAEELSARIGAVVTLKQCKNRYGVLKRDWQAWMLLADSRRGATGLGMNPVTGTFTAPDHFWANLIAQNEAVAKFRDRRLEHEELMQRVFEEVTATGSLQCTPGAEGELGMGADGRRALATANDDRTATDGEGNTVGNENGEEFGSEHTSAEHGRGTPFCSEQGTSNPLFPQYRMGTTNPFSLQMGNRSNPFEPHHAATNTPPFPHHAATTPFPHHAATNTPPFLHQAATNTPTASQHVRTSPPPFPQHEYGTPTTHIYNRGTTSTPPCPQPEIRCSPPLSGHGTDSPPFPRAMPIYPGCNSSGTKRRSKSSATDALSQSINNVLGTPSSRQNQYKHAIIKHACNMGDIVKILGKMAYFQQEPVPPVYWWLIDYLSSDPTKMDVFYALPNDEQRISFAQREHSKAMLAQSQGQGNPTESLPPWHLPHQI